MGHQRLAVVLNVAEKPSVAKELVKHLATAGTTVQVGFSNRVKGVITQALLSEMCFVFKMEPCNAV